MIVYEICQSFAVTEILSLEVAYSSKLKYHGAPCARNQNFYVPFYDRRGGCLFLLSTVGYEWMRRRASLRSDRDEFNDISKRKTSIKFETPNHNQIRSFIRCFNSSTPGISFFFLNLTSNFILLLFWVSKSCSIEFEPFDAFQIVSTFE